MDGERPAISIELEIDRQRQRQIERQSQVDPKLKGDTAPHQKTPDSQRGNSALDGSFRVLGDLMKMPGMLVNA
jgi:hypothetical protein